MIIIGRAYTDNSEYIGRGSPLGNPHKMLNKTVAERNRVCDLYEEHFHKMVHYYNDPIFMKELDRLYKIASNNNLVLGCFCTPLRCHGETIANYLRLRILEETIK